MLFVLATEKSPTRQAAPVRERAVFTNIHIQDQALHLAVCWNEPNPRAPGVTRIQDRCLAPVDRDRAAVGVLLPEHRPNDRVVSSAQQPEYPHDFASSNL